MASKGAILTGMLDRMAMMALSRLSYDSSNRLLVAAGVSGSLTTVTTVTNLTNVGGMTAAARNQMEGNNAYYQGFRANLVVT